MDDRAEVHDLLTTRRARATPERAGLPACADNRRVRGQRALVTLLVGVEGSVRESPARAPQLDEPERIH